MEICGANLYGHGAALIAATGGFLGGTSMMLYMRPSSLGDAARRVLISVVSGVLLARVVADQLLGSKESEVVLGVAFALGFLAWSLLGAIARYFDDRKEANIITMLQDYRSVGSPGASININRAPMPRPHHIDSPD